MWYVTLWFFGKKYSHKWLWVSRKLPHPQMSSRRELNIYILKYRISITWG